MLSTVDYDIFHRNSSENVIIFVKDQRTQDLTDVVAPSTFNLINIADDSIILTDTFTASGGLLVTRQSVGVYQYEFDTATYDSEYLSSFRCVMNGDVLEQNVFIKSVSAKYYKYAAHLSAQVDKSRKSMVDYIENMDKTFESPLHFFVGYSSKFYFFYLERGVQLLNLIPPYTSMTVDSYPFEQFGSLLIDAATIAALEAQGIFAIDTDYDYSLGGNSFVIDHFTKLSGMVSSILERFKENAPKFKNLYQTKGALLVQMSPFGLGYNRLYSALPGAYWSRVLSGTGTGGTLAG
jgi:hypothetical protein